jgi:hypothetical protein
LRPITGNEINNFDIRRVCNFLWDAIVINCPRRQRRPPYITGCTRS